MRTLLPVDKALYKVDCSYFRHVANGTLGFIESTGRSSLCPQLYNLYFFFKGQKNYVMKESRKKFSTATIFLPFPR